MGPVDPIADNSALVTVVGQHNMKLTMCRFDEELSPAGIHLETNRLTIS